MKKKPILIGCGGLLAACFLLMALLFAWLFIGPEGGVRLPNDMETYALEYIEETRLLNETEELLAYYDATIGLNASESVILTTERIVYHMEGRNDSIALGDIVDVKHRNVSFIGDVFEVYTKNGRIMKIEIAPLNLGETFANALKTALKNKEPSIKINDTQES